MSRVLRLPVRSRDSMLSGWALVIGATGLGISRVDVGMQGVLEQDVGMQSIYTRKGSKIPTCDESRKTMVSQWHGSFKWRKHAAHGSFGGLSARQASKRLVWTWDVSGSKAKYPRRDGGWAWRCIQDRQGDGHHERPDRVAAVAESR